MNIKSLNDVFTLSEVEEKLGIKRVTVKKAILAGRLYDYEYKQSGSTWLITKEAVYRLWNYRLSE